ncbi:unnamed protein product [Sphagnum tenellum]
MVNFKCAVWDILSSSGQCYWGKWWTGVPRRGFSTSSGYSNDLLILQRTSGDFTNQEDSGSIYSKREQIWLTSITYSSRILVPKLISGYRLPDAWTDMEQKRRTRNEETAGLHFFTFVFK